MPTLNEFLDVEKYNDGKLDIFTEEASSSSKKIISFIYPKIEAVLKTPKGNSDFKTMVGRYIDRNSSKLYTLGPQYLIPFTDNDKEGYFNLFNLNQKEVKVIVREITSNLNDKSNFIYLNNNPLFFVFYSCIRYYHMKVDKVGLNSALAIYALAVYPSVYVNFFRFDPNPKVMDYTINRLSNKFLIKEAGNIFTALVMSIRTAYDTLKKDMLNPTDADIIKFVSRVHTSQKSLIRNIADNYYDDYKHNRQIGGERELNDDEVIDNDYENNSTVVDTVTNKVFIPIISSGLNLQFISIASKAAGISLADLQYYVSKILTEKYKTDIHDFIHAVLFRFLYDENHKPSEINSSAWIAHATKLFKQTNSNNPNINTVKTLLNKWASNVGIYTKYKREASRSNYKRGIYLYFIFMIQYYNNIN